MAEFTAVGLVLEKNLSFEEWAAVGKTFTMNQWWVGDWLNYGEKTYGETYRAVAITTGYDEGSLSNLASVSRRIELPRRRGNLSWSHHAEVAGLPIEEQDRLLDWAQTEKASVKDLRAIKRADKNLHEPSVQESELRAWIKQECPDLYAVVQGSQYDVQARSMQTETGAFDLQIRGVSVEVIKAACLGAYRAKI